MAKANRDFRAHIRHNMSPTSQKACIHYIILHVQWHRDERECYISYFVIRDVSNHISIDTG